MKNSYIPFLCMLLATVAKGLVEDADVSSYEMQQKILDTILSREKGLYDPRIPPGNRNVSPVEVTVTMYILDISSVNDFKNEFSTQFYFRQKWKDLRLAYEHLETGLPYLSVRNIGAVWKPDTFIVEEREGKLHTIMLPNDFMRIYPNGEILYSVRLSMTFRCNMDLRYFPLDTQKCSFRFESYGSNANEIKYRWDNHTHTLGVSESIDLPDFTVTDTKIIASESKMSTGIYSYLRLDLTFKRKVGFFMNKLYVPFIILVIASWLSFWIKVKFMILRLTLILTILFIMFWLESDITRHTPPVSYTKAVDVWTGVCLSLVFATLLQFILVRQLFNNEKSGKKEHAAVDPEALFIKEGKEREKSSSLENSDTKAISQLIAGNIAERKPLYQKIDVFSRLVYPIIFGVFNLIYWPTYCSGS